MYWNKSRCWYTWFYILLWESIFGQMNISTQYESSEQNVCMGEMLWASGGNRDQEGCKKFHKKISCCWNGDRRDNWNFFVQGTGTCRKWLHLRIFLNPHRGVFCLCYLWTGFFALPPLKIRGVMYLSWHRFLLKGLTWQLSCYSQAVKFCHFSTDIWDLWACLKKGFQETCDVFTCYYCD